MTILIGHSVRYVRVKTSMPFCVGSNPEDDDDEDEEEEEDEDEEDND